MVTIMIIKKTYDIKRESYISIAKSVFSINESTQSNGIFIHIINLKIICNRRHDASHLSQSQCAIIAGTLKNIITHFFRFLKLLTKQFA